MSSESVMRMVIPVPMAWSFSRHQPHDDEVSGTTMRVELACRMGERSTCFELQSAG